MIGRLWHRRDIRRVEIAFAGFAMAEYGTWVSVLVYAYERGGTTNAALVAIAQLLPAGLVAPALSTLADRRGGACALRVGYLVEALTLGVTSALIFVGVPDLLVYASAVLAASAVTMTRPAQAALVPALVDDEDELTAINALSGWVESCSLLAGTAFAGTVMMFAGPDAVIACLALLVAISAALVSPIRPRHDPLNRTIASEGERFDPRDGLTALREDHRLAAVVGLLGAEYFVIGALDVLLVVLALHVLGLSSSGAGYLNAAFGAGGMVGSISAVWLIGRSKLSGPLLGASIGWGVLLALLGAWPSVLGAFLLLVAAGATRTVVDVSGRTMLLREAPPAVRGRVFGLLESMTMLGLALGSVLVPVMVAVGGAGFAVEATAISLVCVTLVVAALLRRPDGDRRAHNPRHVAHRHGAALSQMPLPDLQP